MQVFISHISEESTLASLLKEWIDSTFLGNIDVFVSSEIKDIPGGSKWLDKIDSALDNSKLIVILCSQVSIYRPWINFEAGCGWIKRIPIIPVCHSGLSKDKLPSPLSMFQGLNLTDEKFPQDFFESLKSHFGVKKLPRVNYNEMNLEISNVLTKIKAKFADIVPEDSKNVDSLEVNEEDILIFISENERLSANELSNRINLPLTQTKYYIDRLLDKKYISFSLIMGAPTTYYLNKAGRKYVVENNLI